MGPKAARAWAVAAMLWFFLAINFADKAIFGLAAVPIMRDMHLTHTQLGLLASSFYALFSLGALGFGWLGDRWSTKWLIAAMALVWTAAQLPIVVPIGFGGFMACRILLGAGEGPALSMAMHEAYRWFPDERRPLITGVIESGLPFGAVLTAIAGTWVIANLGWRPAFGMLGIASLLWCIAWLLVERSVDPNKRAESSAVSAADTTVSAGVSIWSPTLVGATLAAMATYVVSSLVVAWLPPFFATAVGLSPAQTGRALTIAWLVQIPLFPLAGWMSQRLHQRWRSTDISRSALATAALVVSGAAMVGLAGPSKAWLAVLLATLCLSATVIAVTAIPPILGEIAPIGKQSMTLGACIGLASLGGVIAPTAFGSIIDAARHDAQGYRLAFLASGGLVIVIAIAARLLMRPSRDRERLRSLIVKSAVT